MRFSVRVWVRLRLNVCGKPKISFIHYKFIEINTWPFSMWFNGWPFSAYEILGWNFEERIETNNNEIKPSIIYLDRSLNAGVLVIINRLQEMC